MTKKCSRPSMPKKNSLKVRVENVPEWTPGATVSPKPIPHREVYMKCMCLCLMHFSIYCERFQNSNKTRPVLLAVSLSGIKVCSHTGEVSRSNENQMKRKMTMTEWWRRVIVCIGKRSEGGYFFYPTVPVTRALHLYLTHAQEWGIFSTDSVEFRYQKLLNVY